ncbi:hypothetical protein [Nocardioides limicola]|uniref:hypothetical protein n=1 Tax=Nocardioides limicola TaxID=2803368 RepID=UPI00193C86A3|nr:hypothetical protein [Nocardioides sp. DJM-14]
MQRRWQVPVAFVVGALVGIVGTIGFGQLSGSLRVVGDPLDYVTVVDRSRPVTARPERMIERLETDSGVDWSLRLFQDLDAFYGGESLREHREELSARAVLADPETWRTLGVLSNVLDPEAAGEHGSLHVIWFSLATSARTWLVNDPVVFIDATVEEGRRTWWTGSFVAYYSPGEQDHTDAVDDWVRKVTYCATHADPCVLPD